MILRVGRVAFTLCPLYYYYGFFPCLVLRSVCSFSPGFLLMNKLQRGPYHTTIRRLTILQDDSTFTQGQIVNEIQQLSAPLVADSATGSWEEDDEESFASLGSLYDEESFSSLGNVDYEGEQENVDFVPEKTIGSIEQDVEEASCTDVVFEEFRLWQQAIETADKSLQRKQDSLGRELKRSGNVAQTLRRANLMKANLYLFNGNDARSAMVHDWETGVDIQLDVGEQYYSASDEVEALFGEIRKLKRGVEIVEPLLQEAESARSRLWILKEQLDGCFDNNDQSVDMDLFRLAKDRLMAASNDKIGLRPPLLKQSNDNRKPGSLHQPSRSTKNFPKQASRAVLGTPGSNVRKLQSPAGCTILVGRNRRGNEFLSLGFAKSNDVWLHARGTPGAHVVIPKRRGSPLITDECLQLAADLAAFYSDGRTERKVLVSLTEAKHLSKPRNAPLGAVNIREELKVLTGRPEYVPDDLKEARAVSGLSDDYRAANKAKLRKLAKKNAERKKDSERKASNKAKQDR